MGLLHIISIFLVIIGNIFCILENGYQDYEISLTPSPAQAVVEKVCSSLFKFQFNRGSK